MTAIEPARKGVSTGTILLVAAALGLVGGVIVAEVRSGGNELPSDEDDPTAEMLKVTPMGEVIERDPMEPDPETLEGITAYPNAAPRKLTSHSAVSGMPMKVSWFATNDSVTDVLAFYEKGFVDPERMVVSHRYNAKMGYVGWVDRAENLDDEDGGAEALLPHAPLHMISAVREGDQTLVFVSKSEPHRFFEQPTSLPDGVLLPPAADAPQIIEQAEFSLDRRTIYSRVRSWSLEETKSFYKRELAKTDWAIVDQADDDTSRVSMVARRGVATQVITLAPEGGSTRILITLDARPAPEMSR